MKPERFTPDLVDTGALRVTARRSIARPVGRAFAAVIACSSAAGLGVLLLTDAPEIRAMLLTLVAVFVVGGIAATVATRSIAVRIAHALVQPVELLLSQIVAAGDPVPEGLHCMAGKPLTREQIEADLALLADRMRGMERQSRSIIAELAHAHDRANEQEKAQSHFVANMSHELRTPLNAILGYAVLLHDDAEAAGDTAAAGDLQRIQIAGRTLLALINDILDLSRIEAGKTTLERSVIDIKALAESVVADCTREGAVNGNVFGLALSDQCGIMVGDPGKVRQCLGNLLSNAFKFTRDGDVTLAVEPVRHGLLPAVRFQVADTGTGIDPERLNQLFEAFQQVDDGPSRKFSGTGLGLAITRRLARMMGGDCTVESKPGEGSTFTLTLPMSPMADPAGDAAALGVAAAPGGLAGATPRAAEHLALVIDDDEAALDLMGRWLDRMGYAVLTSADGEAGLALARSYKPDIILLDALLPGRTGYELLEELRADPAVRATPVVMITVDDDRARALCAGASDYLRKPITEDQLRRTIAVYRGKASGDVLVIDDDDDAAELVKRTVEQLGFSSRRASDGVAGVSMATEAPPSAIVLDLSMPGMNGFEVIERLAADATLKEVPLVVLSSCEITLSQHRQLAAAGHRFFAKGASTPREIAQSIREMVA
jgi:signal transduction histidine kinase/CheY-like chemotaxis protein